MGGFSTKTLFRRPELHSEDKVLRIMVIPEVAVSMSLQLRRKGRLAKFIYKAIHPLECTAKPQMLRQIRQ